MDVRAIRDDEQPALVRTFAAAMGEDMDATAATAATVLLEPERAFVAVDGGALVGTGANLSSELTVPGGATVPTGAVTLVGVAPTHRRRGIADRLVRQLLADSGDRGEVASVLHASEAVIYGRWGYAPALWSRSCSIETVHAAFRQPVDTAGARLVLLDDGAARESIVPLFDAARLHHPGELRRTDGMWRSTLADPTSWRGGAGPRQHVVRIGPQGPDGYAAFRRTAGWQDGLSTGQLHVMEVQALSAGAYAHLWRWLLDTDLVTTVTASHIALDEPLGWLLRDARRLRTSRVVDSLWLRLVDVPAALAARTWGRDGDVTIRVHDPILASNAGLWRLDVSQGRAEVSAVAGDAPGDLELDVDALAAVYLGGVRPSALAHAGRLRARSPQTLRDAEGLFASPVAPRCTTGF